MKIPNGGTTDLGKLTPDMRSIVKVARAANWKVWRTRRGHLRFQPPVGSPQPRDGRTDDHQDNRAGGRTLTHGKTDSDLNAINRFRADLRREGLEGV